MESTYKPGQVLLFFNSYFYRVLRVTNEELDNDYLYTLQALNSQIFYLYESNLDNHLITVSNIGRILYG